MKNKLLAGALAAVVLSSLLLAGCSAPATDEAAKPAAPAQKTGPEVRVASLLDSEGVVLGNMVIKMLESNGIKTVDKTKFGTPDVVRKALLAGDVDATIDYTGSGQYYVGPEGDPLWNDPVEGYAQIKSADASNGVAWLTPAPANNGEYFAVTKEFADTNKLATMEDFAKFVNGGGSVKLVGDQSWMDNPSGLKAYQKAYGFTLTDDQKIGLSNGVTAQFIEAVAKGTDGANVAEVYATDGGLAEMGLVVLTDSKNVPPFYAPAPVFREEIVKAYPEVDSILAPVFKSLTTEKLQALNREVAFGGKSGSDVAQEYLEANGFLK